MPKHRFIVHIDMDAFFAAVEQRDDPSLKGKPVVVGADPKDGAGRGVVSTCSYEARAFGIHSAMPISIAYRKCPHAVFLPVQMIKYSSTSKIIYSIFNDFTPDVEPVSIDEAFLDISTSYKLFGTPRQTCEMLKDRIKKETGLTASVGLAPIKMAAKIASDLKKPDGFVEVDKEGLQAFLRPLDVGKIWGLGPQSKKLMRQLGIRTIGDLATYDIRVLMDTFGRSGAHFWELANGIDGRRVDTSYEAKSVSNETTFEKDTGDRSQIDRALMALAERVSDRLREEGVKGKTVTLKIRFEGFITFTRAVTLERSTNFADTIYKVAATLIKQFFEKGKKVRLVGVKVSNLSPASFRDHLFDDKDEGTKENIHRALDSIKEKFGNNAIRRAKVI